MTSNKKLYIDSKIANCIPKVVSVDPAEDSKVLGLDSNKKSTGKITKRFGHDSSKTHEANLRRSIDQYGMDRPIYIWKGDGAILDGIEVYRLADKLGLRPYKDYQIIEIPCANRNEAILWRINRNVTTMRCLPDWHRCLAVLKMEAYIKSRSEEGRKNMVKGGKGERCSPENKVDILKELADMANVGRSTLYYARKVYGLSQRKDLSEAPLEAIVNTVRRLSKGLVGPKSGYFSIKGVITRSARDSRNNKHPENPGKPGKSKTDLPRRYDSGLGNQVVVGDLNKILPQMKEGAVDKFVFSPPYYIPKKKTVDGKEVSYNAVQYGESFTFMHSWKAYSDWTHRYLDQMYRIIPEGGRIICQVDNTRDPESGGFYYHTDMIRDWARKAGAIDLGEWIWAKQNTTGKREARGSEQNPRRRTNHEYIVVLSKGGNAPKEYYPTLVDDEFSDMTISNWEMSSEEERTPQVQAYRDSYWKIAPRHHPDHPAVYPYELAYRMIQLWTGFDEVVCDPFCGTGTTIAVAAARGRRWIGIEQKIEWAEDALKLARKAEEERLNNVVPKIIREIHKLAA